LAGPQRKQKLSKDDANAADREEIDGRPGSCVLDPTPSHEDKGISTISIKVHPDSGHTGAFFIKGIGRRKCITAKQLIKKKESALS